MITTDSPPMSTIEIRGKKVLIIGSLLEMVAITEPTIETVNTTDSLLAEKVILTETVATISLLLLVAMEEEVPKMMSETASIMAEEVIRAKETDSGTELIMGIIKAEAPPLPRIGDRSLRPLSRSPHPLSAPLPPPTPRPLAPLVAPQMSPALVTLSGSSSTDTASDPWTSRSVWKGNMKSCSKC